jgi:pimeloyl-ACP methyl ester carboxylesterase
MDTTTRYLDRGRIRLAWDEAGNGTPVLLVMGHVFGRRMWGPLVPDLAAHHHVLSWDHRGVGDSTYDRQPFEIATLAEDGFAVMNAAGVESAHVFGVSMGGLVAQEMALLAPERVRSLILGCTGAPEPGHQAPQRLRWLRYRIPRRFAARLMSRRNSGAVGDETRRAADAAVFASTPYDPRALIEQNKAAGRYSSQDRVERLTMPSLVLHGTADETVPLWRGEQLASLLNTRLITYADAGHNFISDCLPDVVADLVAFLRDVDQTGDPSSLDASTATGTTQ